MNIEHIRHELEYNIPFGSTIIVTSHYNNKESFILEEIGKAEFKLSISDKVDSIKFLFYKKSNIKKIIFDNWNTTNLKNISFSFSGLKLDELPDFSKQDFSNIEDAKCLFLELEVNGDIIFTNHSFKKLQSLNSAFSNMTCKNMLIDLGDNSSIIHFNYLFRSVKCDNLNVKINNIHNKYCDYDNMFYDAKINNINMEDFNIDKISSFFDMFTRTNSRKIIMPNSQPQINETQVYEKIFISKVSNNIGKIYCNKEWSKIIEDGLQ